MLHEITTKHWGVHFVKGLKQGYGVAVGKGGMFPTAFLCVLAFSIIIISGIF